MEKLTEEELLQIRMDCLFTYEGGKMSKINEPWGSTANAPLLHAGRTNQGQILYRFSQMADTIFIHTAETLIQKGIWDITTYLKELKCSHFNKEICFYYPTKIDFSTPSCCLINTIDSELLSSTFKDEIDELESAQLFFGYLLNGQIVSICRSVRIGRGHEAGIETNPSFQRRGFASSVLKCWISAVQKQKSIPLYSANTDNVASLNLAKKVGFVKYAESIEIW